MAGENADQNPTIGRIEFSPTASTSPPDTGPQLWASSGHERIAIALERIAAALEAANANDPLTAIERAMSDRDSTDAIPPDQQWRLR
jgi:hypothetical protein